MAILDRIPAAEETPMVDIAHSAPSFAQLLRRHRRELGLTQEALAERAGLSWRTISDLERGVGLPRKDTLALLVEALALDPPARAAFERASRGTLLSPGEPKTPARAADSAVLPTGGYLGAVPTLPLVERRVELARVTAALEAARGGDGRFLALAGEPGIGKTRLAQEVMLQGRAAGWTPLVGRCYEEHDHTPYFLFRDVLTAAWDGASPVLRERAGQRFAALGRLLPDRLSVPPREDDEEARLQILHAVAGFLGALADERPVLVMLDDLHWADHVSLDILRHLVRSLSGQRLLVLGAYRDVAVNREHPLARIVSQLLREQRLEVLPIRPLTSEGTAALIGTRFDLDVVSAEQRDAIHVRTAGNPFFTVEVLAALVEQGAALQAGDGRAPNERPEPLPQSIHSVVGQRIGRLGPEALETLRLASVLGQEFDLEILLTAAEAPEETVLAHVEAALAARLLEERQIGQIERYAFTHALIAQVLYEEGPRFRLRRLHLRTAGALERLRGVDPEAAAEIGRHFLAGGDKEKAAFYTERAGDHAVSLYAHHAAIGHYQAAITLLQERHAALPAAALQRKLGAALVTADRVEEARDVLEAALRVLEAAGDARGQALAHYELARTNRAPLNFAAGWPHLQAALALWPDDREDTDCIRILLLASETLTYIGDHAAASAHVARAAPMAERLGIPGLQGEALLNEALILAARGTTPGVLLPMYARAEGLLKAGGRLSALCLLYIVRGFLFLQQGELDNAAREYTRAAGMAERRLSGLILRVAAVNLCDVQTQLGQWEEARRTYDWARALIQQLDAEWLVAFTGEPWWLLSDAQSGFRRGLEHAQQQANVDDQITYASLLAQRYLALGRAAEAEGPARAAAAVMRRSGNWVHAMWTTPPLVESVARTGAPDADVLLAEAFDLAERIEAKGLLPPLLRARGLLLVRHRDFPGALTALHEGARLAREQHALLQLGATLAVLAEVATTVGDQATALEADVERRAIIERIGPEVRILTWAR